MARFTYKCEKCGNDFKVSIERRYATYPCPRYSRTSTEPPSVTWVSASDEVPKESAYEQCGGIGKPVFQVGGSKVMERLDNGLMPRAVERVHNIEEITAADADAHSNTTEDDDA